MSNRAKSIGSVIVFSVSALLLLTMLCLLGCEPSATQGIVISKRHAPSHTWIQMVQTGETMIPITHYVPERWNVTIRGTNELGNEVESTWSVSERIYDQANEGEFWYAPR